jgi:hypothetical protein
MKRNVKGADLAVRKRGSADPELLARRDFFGKLLAARYAAPAVTTVLLASLGHLGPSPSGVMSGPPH